MKHLYLFTLFLLTLNSCIELESTQETKQHTWIEVYGRYLDSDQLYKVEFTFLRGDTLVAAESFALDGSLKVLDQALEGRKLSEQLIRYQNDFKGDFNGQLTGIIADEAISFKELQLSFKQVPSFQIQGDTLHTQLGGAIIFRDSLRLTAGETLLIMVNDAKKQTISIPLSGPLAIKKLTIPSDYLGNLTATEAGSLYLIAKKQARLEKKEQTLNYLLEHYSAEKKIQLLE